MTAFTVVNMLLGAGLLAAVLLFVAACLVVGSAVSRLGRLALVLAWPEAVPGCPSC